MAKIRGIKPEFWTDEDVCTLSIPARLLFIGMWNYACDNGHLQDKPKQIKRRVLPDDDVNCTELIREIEAAGLIERDDGWVTIPNLAHHQKIDARYFTTCDKEGCEDPPEKVSQRAARRAPAVQTRAHAVRTPSARGDGDGDGDGELIKRVAAANAAPPSRGTRLPEDWEPSPETNQALAAKNPNVNLDAELDNFRDYWLAKSGKDATKVDWTRTWQRWVRNAKATRPARDLPVYRGAAQAWKTAGLV